MKSDLAAPGPAPTTDLLLESRKLAWQVGAVLIGGMADDHRRVAEAARPLAGWLADAPTDAGLADRMDAAQLWLDTAMRLLDAGVEPEANPEAAASQVAGIHAWLTEVPGYGEVQADTGGPALTGRQLFIVRCLLMRATEQGTPELHGGPGLGVDELVAGAVEYAGTATPKVTAAEVDETLRVVFCGDPRDTGPGFEASTPGYGAEIASEALGGPGGPEVPRRALLYPHGPDESRGGAS